MSFTNTMDNIAVFHHLLEMKNAKHIRDPIWNTILLDSSLAPLLASAPMQKLTRILQLGPTHLVYPGATHTRYAHSIGVYHISKLILLNLLCQKHCPVISLAQAKAFLAASLLHDIGHFPYTHSLKNLPLPAHEFLGAELVVKDLHPILTQHDINPQFVAAIISPETHSPAPEDAIAHALFSNLLSGQLDPDKLDYLCRDAFYAGVPYGIQDISYAITQITLDKTYNIVFQSMLPVENVLFSKYLMYSSVYWHKYVRCATAMVKVSVEHALKDTVITPDNLIYLDDQEFITLCNTINHPYMDTAQMVSQGILYTLIYEGAYREHFASPEQCIQIEAYLLKELGLSSIIFDVPEPISFELSHTQESVFLPNTVDAFVHSARKIRVFAPPHTILKKSQKEYIAHIINNA